MNQHSALPFRKILLLCPPPAFMCTNQASSFTTPAVCIFFHSVLRAFYLYMCLLCFHSLLALPLSARGWFYFAAWVFDLGDMIKLICCMISVMARYWQHGGGFRFHFWSKFIVAIALPVLLQNSQLAFYLISKFLPFFLSYYVLKSLCFAGKSYCWWSAHTSCNACAYWLLRSVYSWAV